MSTNLSCAIVGLPNVGKSTLFNALTKQMIAASNFPFCTIDPNIGIVEVADPRLHELSRISKTETIIPAMISFVDIAGLVKGASEGEGLGNQFLSNIRETDLIVQLVRCFDDENIIHVEGKINPLNDIEVINLELILADLDMAEKVFTKVEKGAKGKKEIPLAMPTLQKVIAHLGNSLPLRTIQLTEEELESIKQYPFLTAKPIVYCANVGESDVPQMTNAYVELVRAHAEKEGAPFTVICAKLEEELASLSNEDAKEYLDSLGIPEKGLDKLTNVSFKALGLITFYTSGEKETRAWTIRKGSPAPVAAGRIHTDLQRGFIRAEVISYNDFLECGGRSGAKEKGKCRSEGKNYIVKDDDVILFYHN